MKHLILSILLFALPMIMKAQSELETVQLIKNISEVSKHVDQVHMEGRSLSAYGLSLFDSVLEHKSGKVVEKMRAAAIADGKTAVDNKTIVKNGVVVAAYYQLPPATTGTDNRFVLFREMENGGAMLIYMEGETTLNKIVNIQINRK